MNNVSTQIKVYNTPEDIYEALARVFSEESGETSRWVRLSQDGAEVTFFAAKLAELPVQA